MKVRFNRKGYEYVRLPKSKLQGAKACITIDPDIQFGEPCLAGTRIPAEVIAGMYKAGDNIETLMRSYDITREQVEACIEYVDGEK